MLNWTSLNLWPHQKDALQELTAYLKSASSGSFLVHMPTGSGKTGIIATLARFILKEKPKVLLVLAPRVALRDQLYSEVNGNFFTEKLSLGDDPELKKILAKSNVINFDDSYSEKIDLQGKRLIVISTIQKINTIHNSKKDLDKEVFSFLTKQTDLVIIDEGHYEPAISWSTTIRALGDKRVLFTATPYRNDFKHFDFGGDSVFSFSYNLALKGRFLRSVDFIHAGDGHSMPTPDDLIEEIDRIRANQLVDDKSAKIIIRCDSATRIVQIGEAILRKHKEKDLIAFHENFTESGHPWKRRGVPEPDEMKKMEQVYWVHQFKLLEGVDNKDFRVLVIYDELGNERSLIQQIGRIIRNPDRVKNATAYVIDFFNKRLQYIWKKFRDFDSKLQGGKKDALFLLGSPTKRLNEAIFRNFSSTEYLFNKYRERYEDGSFQPEKDLKIPLRVNFLQKSDRFSQATFCKHLEERFKRSDFQYKQVACGDMVVYYYRFAQNSEYLDEKYSFVLKDGVCLVYNINDDLLAFLDTSSFLPLSDPDTFGILSSYPRKSLRKVFNKKQESFVNRVSAHGTNASLNAIESLSFSAGSVEKTPPFMENKSQVISTLGGYFVKEKIIKNGKEKKVLVHRYLGFGNGRLSDGSSAVALNVYKDWVDGIANLLGENVKPIGLFNRFADIRDAITETDPKYVILSSETIAPYFHTVDGANENLHILSDAAKVKIKKKKFVFEIIANNNKYDAEIEFTKNRYVITCTDLAAAYIKNGLDQYDDIIDYFNSTQLFKVLPKQPETIYHQFNFIHTVVRFGKNFEAETFTVGKIIHSISSKVTSEKGRCLADKSSWTKDSLFGLLDSYLQNSRTSHVLYSVIGKAPDYAVCDDSNEEVADFFLAWKSPMKIVMIHAKYKEAEYGTKALEGVCRQAIANSRYISLYLGEAPPGLKNWADEYVMKDVEGTLKTRIRKTSKGFDAERTWKEMKALINHPLCQREVWLFLGNMLNEKALLTQLKKDDPNEFAINTVQFLNGTMQSVGNIVGTLKIIAVNDPRPKKKRVKPK